MEQRNKESFAELDPMHKLLESSEGAKLEFEFLALLDDNTSTRPGVQVSLIHHPPRRCDDSCLAYSLAQP